MILQRAIVEVYSKANCHLCDVALEVIEEVRARIPFDVVKIDITSSDELYARYRNDIPVVCVNGHRAFKYRLTAAALEARLLRASGPESEEGDVA